MEIITTPTVKVIGATVFYEDDDTAYQLPSDGTSAERLGAYAAKICYSSFGADGRSVRDNQKAVIESMHGSVLEHSHVSFRISGITRAASLELNRHRPWNISQRSTRYTKEEGGSIVLEPQYADWFALIKPFWSAEHNQWASNSLAWNDSPEEAILLEFLNHCEIAFGKYKNQVEWLIRLNSSKLAGFDLRKWARGKARNLLPHALETEGVWSCNHRELRWLIQLRSERHAEPEIRRLANHIYTAVKDLAPTYYEDFEVTGIIDGIPELTPKYVKI
jgi:thymidylate synthase (FAD)